jgi:hypothetical protein
MYIPKTDPIISTTDDEGQPIIFTKAKWDEKNVDHPELLDNTFMANVEKTMQNPEEVWPDYADYSVGKSDKQCYYRKYSQYSYVKVVVWINGSPRRVVTAYEIDCVKEAKYAGLNRLR